jgi:hypothetical protein
MAYTSRYDGPDPTPEEREAKAALAHYTDDPAQGVSTSHWIPTALLYRSYLSWRASKYQRFNLDAPDKLTARQFGRALRRIFPRAIRRKRSYHGQQQWGYSHLHGSNSVLSPDPRKRRKGQPVAGPAPYAYPSLEVRDSRNGNATFPMLLDSNTRKQSAKVFGQ